MLIVVISPAFGHGDCTSSREGVCRELKMGDVPKRHKKYVIGPKGEVLTLADLPPADTKRWVVNRKAIVVAAVTGGLISLEDACSRYSLSPAELFSWHRAIEQSGVAGLRVTRRKQNPGPKDPAKKD